MVIPDASLSFLRLALAKYHSHTDWFNPRLSKFFSLFKHTQRRRERRYITPAACHKRDRQYFLAEKS